MMDAVDTGAPIEPWPGEVEVSDLVEQRIEDDHVLSKKQRRRAEALTEARFVLEHRGGPMAASSSKPPTVTDLLRVAQFILTGSEKGTF